MNIFTRMRESLQDERTRVYWLFAGLQSTFWIACAIGNYFTVFMQENGLSTSTIGIVNAINSAFGIFASLFWGMISDRIGSIKRTVMILLIGTVVLFPLILLTSGIPLYGFPLGIILSIPAYFFRNPSGTLVDNWTVRGCNAMGLNYGTNRAMGSFAFALVSIILSFILPKTGVGITFILSPLMMLAALFFCLRIGYGDGGAARSKTARKLPVGKLFRNYYYVAYLAFYVGLSFTTSANYSFIPMLISEVGASSAQVGLVTGYRAMLEIPMLLLLGVLRRRFKLPVLIVGAGVLFAVEALLLGASGALWQVVLFTTCFGLANGLLLAGGANYVLSLAPEGLEATAQTLVGSAASLAGIVGNACGGFLIELLGASGFYLLLGGVMSVVAVLYLLSFIFGEKILKIPRPTE